MAPQTKPAASIKVRVQPGASENQVVGYQRGVLRLRVTAPPQEGRANQAVISMLAAVLGIAKSRVRIVRGHASREKLVSVESLTTEEVQQRLEGRSG